MFIYTCGARIMYSRLKSRYVSGFIQHIISRATFRYPVITKLLKLTFKSNLFHHKDIDIPYKKPSAEKETPI